MDDPLELGDDAIRRLHEKLRLKHALDRIGSAAALLLVSPLMAALALAIKLDGLLNPENAGPVFYTEPRLSGGKKFSIIKFRTAPLEAIRFVAEDPRRRSIAGCKETTRAGRWILKWYLDELPQLINILRGEMSFVGPRPLVEQMHRDGDRHGLEFRNTLRAGLLGAVQAHKRDPRYQDALRKMKEKQRADPALWRELDGAYFRCCCERSAVGVVVHDLGIVLRGLAVVVRGTP